MYEEKQMFGRCPVCDAITSLDPQKNQLCDRCYQEHNKEIVADYLRMFANKGQNDAR